jgi:hypothetical protein
MALGAAGRNKFFKLKYFIGALSYGTVIQSYSYIKISYECLYNYILYVSY